MNLDERIREKTGKVIEMVLDKMIDGDLEFNAAFVGRAMDWLGGKGKPKDNGNETGDPFEKAMNALKAGRKAGGDMPDVSEEDDPATS